MKPCKKGLKRFRRSRSTTTIPDFWSRWPFQQAYYFFVVAKYPRRMGLCSDKRGTALLCSKRAKLSVFTTQEMAAFQNPSIRTPRQLCWKWQNIFQSSPYEVAHYCSLPTVLFAPTLSYIRPTWICTRELLAVFLFLLPLWSCWSCIAFIIKY